MQKLTLIIAISLGLFVQRTFSYSDWWDPQDPSDWPEFRYDADRLTQETIFELKNILDQQEFQIRNKNMEIEVARYLAFNGKPCLPATRFLIIYGHHYIDTQDENKRNVIKLLCTYFLAELSALMNKEKTFEMAKLQYERYGNMGC